MGLGTIRGLVLELMVPIDQGAFGDTEVEGDFGQAESLGAKFDKAVFGFVRMHRKGSGSIDPSIMYCVTKGVTAATKRKKSQGVFGKWLYP